MLYFFFNGPAPTRSYKYLPPLSLHDALPILLRSYPRRSFRMDTAARAFLLFSRTYNHSFIRRSCQMRPRSIVQNSNTVGAIFRQRWTVVFDSRSEEHTSELQSLMRISYAVFCSKNNNTTRTI